MMSKPKIFCFSSMENGGEGVAYALAEDGACLGSHYCSHEGFIRHDLGVIDGSRPDRHKAYSAHYPNGYEMVFVEAKNVPTHEGIQEAIARNRANQEEARDATE